MSDTQTITVITTKVFNSLSEMKKSTDLSVGMMCETLGYYEKGDGGGARYTIEAIGDTVANEMDIIAIGTDNKLIAKYLYEGKPVNVLQFGAINTYTTHKQGTDPYQVDANNVNPDTRNDQPAIQRAIDYTHDKLAEINTVKNYAVEDGKLVIRNEDCYKNAINTIIIPEGNYVIKTQIKLPPYMRFYLTGDVQFLSVIIPFSINDITTYKLEGTDTSTYSFTPITKIDPNKDRIKIPDGFPERKEIFVKNDFCCGDTKLNLSTSGKDEYNVYKHGTIKICYKFDENGDPINPYVTHANDRYAVKPSINNEIFCGPGSLTINNKSKIAPDAGETYINPYYSCAVEIGSTEENIRFYSQNSHIEGKVLSYENLRFKKLKIRGFHIGMLQHGYSFYSNVISDTEFRENDIAFQFGVYGEEESIVEGYIIKENAVNCGEMNHFRDCLFTGNKISVNILLSGLSATFTSCHFDFENCVFRTAYRTNLTVDKCHIEGTGRELKNKYFPDGIVTESLTSSFKNRAQNDPLDEFVGIMYARPLTEFGGSQVDQYSYVDLNITSSRIVDTYDMPWSVFSYYNSGTATYSDGHFRSRIYLDNNKYTYAKSAPISYLTTEDNGIIHSGFLLSEFPETTLVSNDEDDKMRYEKFACQNVPVISRDSAEYGSYYSASEPRRNYRFLSNRTLANKYPYFQNVVFSDNKINGITITYSGSTTPVECHANNSFSPFCKYDNKATPLCIEDSYYVVDDPSNTTIAPDIVKFTLNNDEIECKKDDVITAALVTDMVTFNSCFVSDSDGFEETQTRSPHHIKFVELDSNENINGTYDYEVPYNVGDTTNMYKFLDTYPCTSACRHIVKNKSTKKIRIEVDYYRSMIITDFEMSPSFSHLHAILVEKNK